MCKTTTQKLSSRVFGNLKEFPKLCHITGNICLRQNSERLRKNLDRFGKRKNYEFSDSDYVTPPEKPLADNCKSTLRQLIFARIKFFEINVDAVLFSQILTFSFAKMFYFADT